MIAPADILLSAAQQRLPTARLYWLTPPQTPQPAVPFLVIAPAEIGRLARYFGESELWRGDITVRYISASASTLAQDWEATAQALFIPSIALASHTLHWRVQAPIMTSPYGAGWWSIGARVRAVIEARRAT